MTTRSIAVASSLALGSLLLVPSAGAVSAEATATPFERLCTAFLAEYQPAAQEGESPTCHDDNNITLDFFGGKFVDHTTFWAVCRAMGFDGIKQTSTSGEWVLFCTSDD